MFTKAGPYKTTLGTQNAPEITISVAFFKLDREAILAL